MDQPRSETVFNSKKSVQQVHWQQQLFNPLVTDPLYLACMVNISIKKK